MQANRNENVVIAQIDNQSKRGVYRKYARLKPDRRAERDCRECRYARVAKNGNVRCSQGQWLNKIYTTVDEFNKSQRLLAVTCPYFDDMEKEL